MNILVFSWRDPKHPLAGGAEQVMHQHMLGWTEAGHSVTLFSSKMPNLPAREILDGVEIIRQGHQYLGVQISAFFYYLKNSAKYDFIVDQFHGLPFFTPLFVRKPKVAVIQEVAGKVWFLNPFPFPINIIVGSIGYIFEPLTFLFYKKTKFITASESAKRGIVNFGISSKNITLVPHGVIVKKSNKNFPKESNPTIVFLGIHSKDKGTEDAIYCFNQLKYEKINFWTLGKFETREYEQKIRRLIKDLNLEKRIKLWGFVSQGKKFELLSKAHLLINPSHHEGWGLVNIEANAMQTPVIAYNSAGLTDSVNNNVSGIILKKNTPKELAKTVISTLEDPRKMKKLQQGALKWSKNFNWDMSRKLSLKIIEAST